MQEDIGQADKIVAAAVSLFASKGYHETSIDDVAESCGMPAPAIRRYFSNKQAIALEITNYVHRYCNAQFFYIARDMKASPYIRFLKLTKVLEEFFTDNDNARVFVKFIVQTNTDPTIAQSILTFFHSTINAYREIFLTAHAVAEAQSLAEDFVAGLQGALVMMHVTGSHWPLRRLSARFLRALNP
jgi:TetR/AcrR family transcriptional regulator, transcriptional repressor for nem operon